VTIARAPYSDWLERSNNPAVYTMNSLTMNGQCHAGDQRPGGDQFCGVGVTTVVDMTVAAFPIPPMSPATS